MIELSALQAKTGKIENMCVLHVTALQMARNFMDALQNTLPSPAEIKLVEVTPGLTVHSGTGMVGTVFVVK